MEPDIDEKKVVIEAISTLVYVKNTMVDLILRPAGIPPEVYKPLLNQRDEGTGRVLSKRQMAPLLIADLEVLPNFAGTVKKVIEIAASWSDFHLAHDEYAARATVQKARELLGRIELMEERETKQRELARKEEVERLEGERSEMIRTNSELLLMMFDELATSTDFQRRGYFLQDLLNRTFDLHQIPVVSSFTRNEGAEQIDGAFRFEGWHYIVECRWRERLADIRQLDGLKGQVSRSGKQTMGLFLSINGWSENVPNLLKQNPEKAILLMEGYDLRCVLDGQVGLHDLLMAKVTHLNLKAEPFLSMPQHLKNSSTDVASLLN